MSHLTKICPYCAEEILMVAIKCKHCKTFLDKSKDPNYRPKSKRKNSYSNDPMMKMILPVGRSPLAILAGYAGLFSFIIIGAPFALLFGILALRDIKKNPETTGKGRAWFGIITGGLVSFFIGISVIVAIFR